MYGIDPSFWLKLLLILAVLFVIRTVFNAIVRRWLGVGKPKAFSNNPVNEKHEKIDWSIRIFFIGAMVLGYFINVTRPPQESYLLLDPLFLLIILAFVTEIVRAAMERRYAKNPNAYIYTISQLIFITALLILLFITDFFNLF